MNRKLAFALKRDLLAKLGKKLTKIYFLELTRNDLIRI
ncbi:hypothetical protein VCHENC01_2799 [Vibrio harveyi]|nr:hypothetical protein VCHENC01_2799 [Vibrio harveyi]